MTDRDAVLESQLEYARLAVGLVAADVAATTTLPGPPWEYRKEEDFAVRVAYFGRYASTTIMSIDSPHVVAEVADFMQEEIIEELWSPWPICPLHGTGTYAQVVDGSAVWYCPLRSHALAQIGSLAR